MKFEPQTTQLMCSLENALHPDRNAWLLPIIENAGLDQVLGSELFKAARFLERKKLLMFLSTLGIENSDEPEYYQRWLVVSQCLAKSISVEDAAKVCAGARPLMVGFYEDLLRGVMYPATEQRQFNWVGVPCNRADMLFATDLVLDHSAVGLLPQVLRRWQQLDTTGEPWLWICRTVAERVEYAQAPRKANALSQALAFLLQEISPAHASLVPQLAPHLVNLYLRAEQSDKALALARTCEKTPSHAMNYWLMCCHAHRHEFEEALVAARGMLDATLRKAMTEELIDLNVKTEETIEGNVSDDVISEKKERVFNVDAANDSLKTVNRILRDRGLQPFLMSGVLLGYWREGAILAHDKDLDIGLIGWEQQYEVAQALLDAGHYQLWWSNLKGQDTYLFYVMDLNTGITIDFFFYHQHEDHYLHGIDYKYGFTQNFRFSRFGLTEVDFLGDKFFIPDNADQNLAENYGDWRTPQKSYVVTVEAPALTEKGSLKHQFIAVVELMRCVTKFKSVARAQRILDSCDAQGIDLLSDDLKGRIYEWMIRQSLH